MHILGLDNGSVGGNSEILLKAALKAAVEASPSTTISLIHVPSVSVPRNPKPLSGVPDVSGGTISNTGGGDKADSVPDDRAAVLNAIVEADALIFSTSIYSHQPAGTLKVLIDRILGPFADALLVSRIIEGKKAGDPRFKDAAADERILKPRVVGFIAVAGSVLDDQITMALPTLHQFVYCLHAKVVDQEVFRGFGNPGAVLLHDGAAIKRAQLLGQNVASQLGKQFDHAKYLGPEPEGACPNCHLAKIDLFGSEGNGIGCVVCGTKGKLVVKEDGSIRPVWEEDSVSSCITWRGKDQHIDDIQAHGKKEKELISADGDFEKKRDEWRGIEIPKVKLPSST